MEIKAVNYDVFNVFDKDWALVTAGNKTKYNTMTVAWGALGTLWCKPVVIVFVKPIRYTSEFMLREEYFTVSMYDEEFRDDLRTLGRKSGRSEDKVGLTKLHPKFLDKAVTFEEAKTTFVLRKIYTDQLKLEEIPEFAVKENYLDEDPHYVFVGQVEEVIEG